MPNEAPTGPKLVHQFANLNAHKAGETTTIVKGEDVYVFDRDGKRYLDAMGGSSCAALGFSSPELLRAMTEQANLLPYYHLFAQKSHEPAEILAEKLIAATPDHLRHVLFASSGSEANDTAVKLAWAHNAGRGLPEKRRIIARKAGYHGSTTLSAALTGQPHMQLGFNLPMEDVCFIPEVSYYRHSQNGESEEQYASRCAAELEAAIIQEGPEKIAALIVEPIMASAGCLLPPAGYFDQVTSILQKYDVLLIADEVVCGLGRLGAPFGSSLFNLRPNLMTLGKPLTGGYFPLSAILMTDEIYETLAEQSDMAGILGHGLTYGGHPVGCAVACVAMDIYASPAFRRDLNDRVKWFEAHLDDLSVHPIVGDVRNAGLLGAVEIVGDRATRKPFPAELRVSKRIGVSLQRNGVITRWTERTVNLCPPLTISQLAMDELFEAMRNSLDDVYAEVCSL